ncbi:ketosamine-3-kinase-like [Strongylocentrotus purpuratus]|uniref:protein-ribulosamine 3-kinase n=1 Tax=Strongylocentrotus purpuratus TaxID=7668 RepID=A0A7M7PDA5_STRPU|nr:ketosamine-3-kinase-like [Strongylocentrotus purpuratus]
MEKIIRDQMGLMTLEEIPNRGGGCINQCKSFQTERGNFCVKMNTKRQTRTMFEGEKAGLEAIIATGTVPCPRPYDIYDNDDGPGSIFVMEHLDLRNLDQHAAALGEAVASLHLHNSRLMLREKKNDGRIGGSHHVSLEENGEEEETQRSISQFGFGTTTCLGYLALDNTWSDDWVDFFVRQRLKPKVDYIEQKWGDRTLIELWPRLVRHIPRLFRGIDRITPALLHGDLHGGNVAETATGPVIYDPACFYGHHELELAATRDFVDFNQEFFPAYHRLIPRVEGFDEREKLYKIFCYLFNWPPWETN